MKMKKTGITFKLFIVTTIFFMLFLLVVAVSQSMFFEGFYIRQKIGRLEKSIIEFTQRYDGEAWNQVKITKNISKFIDENNAQVAILNENGAVKHLPTFNMVIETENSDTIMVPINNMNLIDSIKQLKLSVGDSITITGVYGAGQQGVIYPYRIENNSYSWEATPEAVDMEKTQRAVPVEEEIKVYEDKIPLQRISPGLENEISTVRISRLQAELIYIDMQEIKGTIKELNFPEQKDFMMPYRENMLWSAIDNWFWLSKSSDFTLKDDELITYQYVSPINGIENIVMVKPIFENGQIKEMVFAMSSLQPVGEAIGVMKDYYIYGLIVALMVILTLSYFYSRLITTPLIKINSVAVKMAELDFSEKCDVTSDDEIGNLAVSLNVLSANLKNNMKILQDTNERLKIEIEKERSLEAMRKEFISSVSHELKTPLGIMKGFTEGLKDGVAIEKRDYYFDVVLDEIEKMDALVLDMLDLSRLESKAYELYLEEFDITELIEEVKHRFCQQLEEENLKLYLNEKRELWVWADRRRIEQVIVNVFTNAIRHTKKNGHIKIEITEEEPNITVLLENEGEAIPENKLKHIWERFYRVEAARDRQSGGTGLGLSIVKNVLELHGSNYGVKNTHNGVLFYFTLKKSMKEGIVSQYDQY